MSRGCGLLSTASSPPLRRLILYGANNIDVPVKSYPKLFFEEVLHPFYIFQILSIALWMYEKYFYYAGDLEESHHHWVFDVLVHNTHYTHTHTHTYTHTCTHMHTHTHTHTHIHHTPHTHTHTHTHTQESLC